MQESAATLVNLPAAQTRSRANLPRLGGGISWMQAVPLTSRRVNGAPSNAAALVTLVPAPSADADSESLVDGVDDGDDESGMSSLQTRGADEEAAPLLPAAAHGTSSNAHAASGSGRDATVGDLLDAAGYGVYQRRLLAFTGMTQFADAMELILISFLAAEVKCPWALSKGQATALQVAVLVGMGVGAYTIGLISDRRGRRVGTRLSIGVTAVAGILSALAPSYGWLVATRFCVGCGVGAAPAALSLFSELLPSAHRGANLILFFAFFSAGAAVEALVAWAMLSSSYGWRALLLASAVPSVCLLVVSRSLPETPRYLVVSGRPEEAKSLLRRIAVTNGRLANLPPDWDNVNVVVAPRPSTPGAPASSVVEVGGGSVNSLSAPSRGQDTASLSKRGTMDLLCGSPTLQPVTVVLCAMFFLMAALYYSIVLVNNEFVAPAQACGGPQNRTAPVHTSTEFLDIVVTNSAELPGLALAAFLLDRIGRRTTIGGFFVACGAFCAVLLVPGVRSLPTARTALVFCARACALGFNQSLWVFTTELYPTPVRTLGLGVTTSFARVGSVTAPFIVQYAFGASVEYGVFICVCVALVAAALSTQLPSKVTMSDMATTGPAAP